MTNRTDQHIPDEISSSILQFAPKQTLGPVLQSHSRLAPLWLKTQAHFLYSNNLPLQGRITYLKEEVLPLLGDHEKILLTFIKGLNLKNFGSVALAFAVKNRYKQVTSFLLTKKEDLQPCEELDMVFINACASGLVKTVRLLHADNLVNPAAHNNRAFKEAWEESDDGNHGASQIVELLLKDKRVNPNGLEALELAGEWRKIQSSPSNELLLELFNLPLPQDLLPRGDDKEFIDACKEQNVNRITTSLLGGGLSPKWIREGFCFVCKKGYIDIVNMLLRRPNIDLGLSNGTALIEACKEGEIEVARQLLQDQRVDPAARSNWALIIACQKGHAHIVDLLLRTNGVNPADQYNLAFIKACKKGRFQIVRRLLQDKRVTPTTDQKTKALKKACTDHLGVVDCLLKHTDVDPNKALLHASKWSEADIVIRLLDDPRTDLSNKGHRVLINALKNWNLKASDNVVPRLLQSRHIDPAAQKNKALIVACERGYINIVNQLLQDPRVDPSVQQNEILNAAINRGEMKIIRLLINDRQLGLSTFARQKAIYKTWRAKHTGTAFFLEIVIALLSIKSLSYTINRLSLLAQRLYTWQTKRVK